ncbi:hypothetical protein [Aequorivita lipolytica]|uniref:Uncharacterized protein n=1 Tax=Aequorivita lipolytica TaxID=153267 RepID=A0A5C6YP65_9FLAO|nr:hypothetical protein [Aequorivita lipolytica]TXD69140.1 hypothetical protein ESV24_08850 [Aequorivita lipolytica]SRX51281.1 hypothetical protein AEQU2_01761 [Aequorivita lipolytica]
MAQVGINNPNPTATLDVTGSVLVGKNLYLENPGEFPEIRGSQLLIKKTDEQVVKYDIDQSKYGPINYVQFVFRNTNTIGLQNYDTKISANDYLVTVQGFYFLVNGTNSTNITIHSNIAEDNIEGYQIYAYTDNSTQTWHIKGFVNDSTFRNDANADTAIDLYINLIIFRNGFIAKPLENVYVNMNNQETKTVPAPTGF